ncbi:hypothetical protein CHS0354_009375 [Potamilus streckersoni]|uniref:Glycosyltransferase 61 catalytic domain-containing protein n=1 Tax=Potamilus streckersoni TaxID=2493646 RepID=A0AAE0W7L6_9BIVA|nr:hypothetical protein CHS0354_009375 [Potamilus streckersoni]
MSLSALSFHRVYYALRKNLKIATVVIVILCLNAGAYFLYSEGYPKQIRNTEIVSRKSSTVWTTDYMFVEQSQLIQSSLESNARIALVAQKNLKETKAYDCSLECYSAISKNKTSKEFAFFMQNFTLTYPLLSWTKISNQQIFCDGSLEIINNRFAKLSDVVMFPYRRNLTMPVAKGGESFQHVRVNTNEKEVYDFLPGFWEIYCNEFVNIPKTNLDIPWLDLLRLKIIDGKDDKIHNRTRAVDLSARQKYIMHHLRDKTTLIVKKFTVALERVDYDNMYSSMNYMFSIFILMVTFRQQPNNVCIIFLDGHPASDLDLVFETLYGPIMRLGHLASPVVFTNLVWMMTDRQSILNQYNTPLIPYLNEFREFILQQYGIQQNRSNICPSLKITIVWRRDKPYSFRKFLNPRQHGVRVERKILNEKEILSAISSNFTEHCVRGYLLETMQFEAQLRIIQDTDILIGMHGAGLTLALFLPQHAGVLEFFPKDWRETRPWSPLFQAISRWRHLHYLSWQNDKETGNLPYDFTYIPVEVIIQMVSRMTNNICH